MLLRSTPSALPAIAVAIGCVGCTPKISSFDVTPRSLCPRDSAHVTYHVRGTPSLSVHLVDVHGAGAVSAAAIADPDTLEFQLTVIKGKGQAVRRLAILQFADVASAKIVFPTTLRGDTVIASGIKNPTRWGDQFAVFSITSASTRQMDVVHAGRTIHLRGDAEPSNALAGTPLEGPWELREVLSGSPGAALRSSLDRLTVNVTMQCKGTN